MGTACQQYVFSTSLGWIAFEEGPLGLRRLVFAYPSGKQAVRALAAPEGSDVRSGDDHPLAHRLREYALGEFDDFLDLAVDHEGRTPFSRAVLEGCRRIAPGETLCYGELAERVGSPRAARAVGQVMSTNRVPIVIPCHRVVAACGRLGGFSAPGGLATKERLLRQEARWQSPMSFTEHEYHRG